ncbi:hypothetical protein Q8A67_006552 [Cirrhinus molitorella]|uniref:Uncharacterized protein n=1 Tax=Cirrhinus molitorella TaxID=172907 RepID=A0AA88U1D4_9TELE|nr:hypothetical protein Q8A67_006552 [Cirrhinus molitorella]
MPTEPFIPSDEHDELITALMAGRWWAIMEVEDLLRSSSAKGEYEHLPSGQCWGIVEEAPVPTAFPEEAPAPARSPEGALVPSASPEGVYVSTVPHEEAPAPARSSEGAPVLTASPKEAPALARSPEGANVSTASSKEAPSQARASMRRKIMIPEKMRLYLKSDVILTPLPLKGPALLSRAPKEGPVPSTSPEEAPVLTVSPEEAHAPAKSPEGELMPTASSKEAPALARSPEKALGPTRSPGKAAVPIRSINRATGPATPLRGVPWKRLCPWRSGALDNVGGVQTPPRKKQCVRKDPKSSASSQHTLSSGSA